MQKSSQKSGTKKISFLIKKQQTILQYSEGNYKSQVTVLDFPEFIADQWPGIRDNLIIEWELLSIQEVTVVRSPHWYYKAFIEKSFGVFLWQTSTCPKMAPKTGKSSRESAEGLRVRENCGSGWEQDDRRVFIRGGERKEQVFKRKKV